MCGIAGVLGRQRWLIKKMLKAISHRGRDGFRLKEIPNGIIGFTRHRVVGDVMQPLTDEEAGFVANCEIYNYTELSRKFKIPARNDAELFFRLILYKGIKKAVELVEGQFSVFYTDGDSFYLFRDIFGINPLFYSSIGRNLFFTSSYFGPTLLELHPSKILQGELSLPQEYAEKTLWRRFSRKTPKAEDPVGALLRSLQRAMKLKAPKGGALLISSGVDSQLLALAARKNIPLIHVYHRPKELKTVKAFAKAYGFDLFEVKVSIEEIRAALSVLKKKILSQPLKLSFSLVFFFSAKFAREELGERYLLSGIGADELFGGYSRMVRDPVKETRWALQLMYERTLTPANEAAFLGGTELRHPYLTKEVLGLWASLPPELLKGKKLLYQAALEFGLKPRKKTAAQYGAGFSRAVKRLKQVISGRKRPSFLLCSGGKDSWASAVIADSAGYAIKGILTFQPEAEDSWMFHRPCTSLVFHQAEAAGLAPLILKSTGKKEDALEELINGFIFAKRKFKADVVVVGAILSEYQRDLVQEAAEVAGISVFAPLWALDGIAYLKFLVRRGIEFVIVDVAAEGLERFKGKVFSSLKDVKEIIKASMSFGFHPAGEGGEYETVAVRCPLWKKDIKKKLLNMLKRCLKP